jgi:threonine dehydrogenase-like Zn-dependent dehydrogenase
VEVLDPDESRAGICQRLGVGYARPADAQGDCDIVIHASATEAGLARSLELLATEGTVVELSWYGDRPVSVPLGEFFHSRRLTVRGSQVGGIAPGRRRGYADRLALSLDLLADPRFETLVTGRSGFAELPEVLSRLADGSLPALCHVIDYPEE